MMVLGLDSNFFGGLVFPSEIARASRVVPDLNGRDEMDGGSGNLHSVFQRAFLRFEARESGKQRRMHVHDSVMIVVDELWADDSKVACKSNKTVLRSHSVSLESGYSLLIVLGVHFRQSLVVQNYRLHAVFLGYLNRSDTWFVTDDNIHLALRDVLSINGVQDRF